MGRNWRVMHGWHWCVAFLWTALPGCAATYHVSPGAPAIVMRGDATLAWRDTAGERCIPDVPVALAHLPQQGTALGFHLAGAEGVGGYRRHWQGIQRLSTGDTTYFFISRSGSQTAVLIASFGSRPPGGGALGTSWVPAEGGGNGAPPEADRVVARIPFDSGYTHAGGLSLVGTVLAVPMDGRAIPRSPSTTSAPRSGRAAWARSITVTCRRPPPRSRPAPLDSAALPTVATS